MLAPMRHVVRYVRNRRALRAALSCALASALIVAAATIASADDIYKCVDPSGRVTYQSEACGNGRAIDIAPGRYDADAAARLREDAAAFNARDDLRRVAEARERAARAQAEAAQAEATRARAAADAARVASDECYYCGNAYPLWGYLPWRPPHEKPPRPPKPPPRPPSYIVVR
jgi:hypothetical protein